MHTYTHTQTLTVTNRLCGIEIQIAAVSVHDYFGLAARQVHPVGQFRCARVQRNWRAARLLTAEQVVLDHLLRARLQVLQEAAAQLELESDERTRRQQHRD